EGLDQLSRHRVAAGPGLEILERTLGLCTPIAVRGDRDFAHGIFFDSSLSHDGCSFLLLTNARGLQSRQVDPHRGVSLAGLLAALHNLSSIRSFRPRKGPGNRCS